MGKNLYAKIIFGREGVVFEKKYDTEAESKAFVDGFNATIESLDIDDDEHYADVHDEPAVDE